jgi:hypothetical protein
VVVSARGQQRVARTFEPTGGEAFGQIQPADAFATIRRNDLESQGANRMQYQIINEKDAPDPPAKKSDAAIEADNIVKQLAKGKVAKVEPAEGQTLRGLRVGLGRAAKEAGVKIQTWDAEGVLYVKLV